jgi:hypothetical protein
LIPAFESVTDRRGGFDAASDGGPNLKGRVE